MGEELPAERQPPRRCRSVVPASADASVGCASLLCRSSSKRAGRGALAQSRRHQERRDSFTPADGMERGWGCSLLGMMPTCHPALPELPTRTSHRALGLAAPTPGTAPGSATPLTRSQQVPEGHQALLNATRGFELCSLERTGATKFPFRMIQVQDTSLNCLLENKVVIQAIKEKSAQLTA